MARGFDSIGGRARPKRRVARQAAVSALAVALVSPSLILIRALHDDSPWMIPQRLHVLMVYGEGPHISALSMLPAALAASFVALRAWRPAALAHHDLSGLDLSNQDLSGGDFTGANLQGCKLDGTRFCPADPVMLSISRSRSILPPSQRRRDCSLK